MSRFNSEVFSEYNIPKRIKFTEAPHSMAPWTRYYDRARQATQRLQCSLGLATEVQELNHIYNLDSMPEIPVGASRSASWSTVEVRTSDYGWAEEGGEPMVTGDEKCEDGEDGDNDSEDENNEEPECTAVEGQRSSPSERGSEGTAKTPTPACDGLPSVPQGSMLEHTNPHQPTSSSDILKEVTTAEEHITRSGTESVPIKHNTPKTPVAQTTDKVYLSTLPQTESQGHQTERTISTVTEASTPSTNIQIMPLRRAAAVDGTDPIIEHIAACFDQNLKLKMDKQTSQVRSSMSDASKQKNMAGGSPSSRAAGKRPRYVDAMDVAQLLVTGSANNSQPAMPVRLPALLGTGATINDAANSERSRLLRSVRPCTPRIEKPEFRFNHKIRPLLCDYESPLSFGPDPKSSAANTLGNDINYWLLHPTTLTDIVRARKIGLGTYKWKQSRTDYSVEATATIPPGEIRFIQMRIPSSARGEVMRECLDWIIVEVYMFLDGQTSTFCMVFPKQDVIDVKQIGSKVKLRVGKHGFLPRMGVHHFESSHLRAFQEAYANEEAIITMEQVTG